MKPSRAKFFQVFRQKIKSCNFLSFCQSCWNCIFKLPRSRVCNDVRPVQVRRWKVAVRTFLPKPGCSDRVGAGIIKSHNFFCLRSFPDEISHSNSPNREVSNDVSDVVVRRRKVALHIISHLTPTEAWRSAVSTTWEGRRVSSGVPADTCTQVFGG